MRFSLMERPEDPTSDPADDLEFTDLDEDDSFDDDDDLDEEEEEEDLNDDLTLGNLEDIGDDLEEIR